MSDKVLSETLNGDKVEQEGEEVISDRDILFHVRIHKTGTSTLRRLINILSHRNLFQMDVVRVHQCDQLVSALFTLLPNKATLSHVILH